MKKIKIPESAYFKDYAAMAYNYEIRKLAILSQEDAAFWVGWQRVASSGLAACYPCSVCVSS